MSTSEIRTLSFNFQAPYSILGNAHAKNLWIVLHGYGQLAPYFIQKFRFLEDNAFIIAPQGLSHFYLQGTSGRVGTSWMTKENRELAISNYISYLNSVYQDVQRSVNLESKSVYVLGFSQGVSTLIRWLVSSHIDFDKMIMCAGSFPSDISSEISKQVFSNKTCYYLYGDQDPYINKESVSHLSEQFHTYGLHVDFKKFSGKHEIPQSLIQQLI